MWTAIIGTVALALVVRHVLRPFDPGYAEDKEVDEYLKESAAREKRERREAERAAKRRG
jgi:hypothetical protein